MELSHGGGQHCFPNYTKFYKLLHSVKQLELHDYLNTKLHTATLYKLKPITDCIPHRESIYQMWPKQSLKLY